MRSQWQIDQGKKCSCRGSDEYCACQNVKAGDPYTLKQAAIQHLIAARQCIAQIPEDHDPGQNGNYHEATEYIDAARYRLGD